MLNLLIYEENNRVENPDWDKIKDNSVEDMKRSMIFWPRESDDGSKMGNFTEKYFNFDIENDLVVVQLSSDSGRHISFRDPIYDIEEHNECGYSISYISGLQHDKKLYIEKPWLFNYFYGVRAQYQNFVDIFSILDFLETYNFNYFIFNGIEDYFGDTQPVYRDNLKQFTGDNWELTMLQQMYDRICLRLESLEKQGKFTKKCFDELRTELGERGSNTYYGIDDQHPSMISHEEWAKFLYNNNKIFKDFSRDKNEQI